MKKQTQKRLILSFIAVFLLSLIVGQVPPAKAAPALDINVKNAILIDATTGKILYEKNADQAAPIASMVKMMTEYLVLEAIDEGRLSWDQTTQISQYAYDISANNNFSGVGLRLNHDYTVEELYKAMAIYSDNATTITLAELLAGSEGEFVKLMNKKAEELGLPDYEFVNSTGLSNSMLGDNYPEGTSPDGDNMLSARSVALLAYSLIRDYPHVLDISSIPQLDFYGEKLDNWNWMLKHDPSVSPYLAQFYYEGMDGLKTGTTPAAGYCFTGTAERNGKRLISVVMGATSEPERFRETSKLLDYGFNNFEQIEVYPEGYQLKGNKDLKVVKGKEKEVEISTEAPVRIIVPKGVDKSAFKAKYVFDKKVVSKDKELTAPFKEGTKVGHMAVSYDGDDLGYITPGGGDKLQVALVTDKGVEKTNWFVLMMRGIGGFFGDIWSSVANTVKGWF
ncbi:D-alanyl-D-alanine carboxypeptidase family protein [Fredinandcohnia sp. QZ13]|uniref:D-alanyl-D-alanine carboxypeptidase family protein n=1 Tax=Fredinandcohnia sp. QZ13 TaxID=3073144 RepID=UPI00285365BD|nr:D-alanyl-D-alanine carboxypeptidase family protein [Fredinandcohnia sp. QZ13]MDR4890510.1 D-alanyl-D-alanine carboxypeptidase family protein [Fredinandcohnia sp. QZ13]